MPRTPQDRSEKPAVALREEAEAAARDPDDRAEALRVRQEMDALAAPWAHE
jgi:hypothetical protein